MSQSQKQMGPLKTYQNRLNDGELKADPEQEKAAQALQRVHDDVVAYKPKKGLFSKREDAPQGLYMYGGVGRGKSMLMDLFFECLPEDIPSRRVHFHEFMIEVHEYLHAQKTQRDQSITKLAKQIAEQSRVLCFDEFHVTDVTDAMILGRLFKGVFGHGVVVIATSNWEPDRLYEGGLKRDRFLPFIALLKTKMEVLHLDSPTDYRTKFLTQEGTYFYPIGGETQAKLDHLFSKLTDGAEGVPETLVVKGHDVEVAVAAKGVARVTFQQMCERPYGAEDYIAIAEKYHTVFMENVRRMNYDRRNEAKRFMNFIDAMYEARARVIISANALPDALYHGEDHAFEFERTVSRLLEMQSAEYLDKAA